MVYKSVTLTTQPQMCLLTLGEYIVSFIKNIWELPKQSYIRLIQMDPTFYSAIFLHNCSFLILSFIIKTEITNRSSAECVLLQEL